ncbi:MAG: Sec-independent protein translocase protein TatB [Acidobacteria bacterium]|nr:Sec-independent protein translocase protein TatB [Acidobacteriota bacterium]
MFLFIFESLGTSELILIGIVALIFLGPRKLPLMARKIGKMMAEFRSTAGEFRETWSREVNFEEEAKSLQLSELESEETVSNAEDHQSAKPSVKEVDPEAFKRLSNRTELSEQIDQKDTADEKVTKENERAEWL